MRQQICISIDRSTAYDTPSERIQRIVFYDTKNTAGSENPKDIASESVALRETDVVINTNGSDKIKSFRVERKRDRCCLQSDLEIR